MRNPFKIVDIDLEPEKGSGSDYHVKVTVKLTARIHASQVEGLFNLLKHDSDVELIPTSDAPDPETH